MRLSLTGVINPCPGEMILNASGFFETVAVLWFDWLLVQQEIKEMKRSKIQNMKQVIKERLNSVILLFEKFF